MNLSEIIHWTHAKVSGYSEDLKVEYLYTDTRTIANGENSIFIALRGTRRNGHEFIRDAYNKGVRIFIVDAPIESFPSNTCWLEVKDTLIALQQLATEHRLKFNLPVLAITGSNGKTIVKEWLFQLLSPFYTVVRSPKSYNSQLGVPLSIVRINKSHELGIFEAGISQRGEMPTLRSIIKPNLGLFTMIGAAHNEGFDNRKQKLAEKIELFTECQKVYYRKDQEDVHQMLNLRLPEVQKVNWSSKDDEADLFVKILDRGPTGFHLSGCFKGQHSELVVMLKDDTDFENFCHCWLICLDFGVDTRKLNHAAQRLVTLPMRLERTLAINNCVLLNDSYSNDLEALEAAITRLVAESEGSNRVLILSDSIQSDKPESQLFPYLDKLIRENGISRIVTVGPGLANWSIGNLNTHEHFHSTLELIQALDNNRLRFQSEFILLKGARKYAFERISQRLARQTHEVRLEVNLDAISNNLAVLSEQIEPETKLMVMIKAAAYGTGGIQLAKLLEQKGVDFLGVANVDEGISLRKAGISLPILILNASANQLDLLQKYRLEPEVYSFEMLDTLARYSRLDSPPIHIKLDTGMHRLGFMEEDDERLKQRLRQYPELTVRSIFSHLAASESSLHDDYSVKQAEEFSRRYESVTEPLSYRPIRHILNSSGILRFSQYQMEMVRLGIGLYGYTPHVGLEHALRLSARLVQTKNLKSGSSVGYGRSQILSKDTKIGIINIGYADGVLRGAGKGNFKFFIRGKTAPTLGNICMDLCMVDLTDIPDVEPGEEVIVFGPEWPVSHLAQALNTIPYEIFTNLSARIKRVYLSES